MNLHEVILWIRRHPFLVIVVLLFVADMLLMSVIYASRHHDLRVTFLDVGQGDAVLIEAPNGNQLLYDAGPPSGASLRALGREMSFWDRSIDVAVLSHPDMDHVGGFPEIFKRYDIGVAVVSGATSDNGVHKATQVAITEEHAGKIVAKQGMRIELGSGVTTDILYPDRDMSEMETNSASIVMRLNYGSTSFLFSGDLPKNIESYLVDTYGNALDVDVLKLGHHGSRTSTGEEWLLATTPTLAVISAGKDNRYGHPHKEVLELLGQLQIPHFGTYEKGTITISSDGKTITRP